MEGELYTIFIGAGGYGKGWVENSILYSVQMASEDVLRSPTVQSSLTGCKDF